MTKKEKEVLDDLKKNKKLYEETVARLSSREGFLFAIGLRDALFTIATHKEFSDLCAAILMNVERTTKGVTIQ